MLKLSLYMCISLCISVTVITQPDNTTTCEGGIVVFTCVIDIRNVNISTEDIRWWRIREDINKVAMLPPSFKRYNITNNISELRLTSVLMITDVRLVDLGSYWLGLTIFNERLCNKAFLSIGMYTICTLYTLRVCMYVCTYVYCI